MDWEITIRMNFIGIDNGLDGGLVLLRECGEVETQIMPTIERAGAKGNKRDYDISRLHSVLLGWVQHIGGVQNVRVILEAAQPMPEQGVSSTFSTGKGFGIMLGLLNGLYIPFTVVHPRTWSTRMLRDMPKGDRKAAASVVAQRLFPEVNFRASDRCRKAHTGLVDALLLAAYGRDVMMAESNKGDKP